MKWIDEIALLSLRGFPASIQSRILNDFKFQEGTGINGVIAPFDDAGRIRLGDLLDAVRRVYSTQNSNAIQNLDGEEVFLELYDGQVVIKRVADQERDSSTTHFEFSLLSPDVHIRRDALAFVSDQFGITASLSSEWPAILDQRPLSNQEIDQIHDAILQSVPHWRSVTQDRVRSKALVPADFVPSNLQYFKTLCGPLPNGVSVDEYVRGPLAGHRNKLVSEDLMEGLSLLLPGSLHADASVVSVLPDSSVEDVWEAASHLQGQSDPFTLLGLVEVGLAYRDTKPEFDALVSMLIEKLCGDSLPGRNGLDVYDIFPSLVGLTLSRLRHIDSMITQPSYWH